MESRLIPHQVLTKSRLRFEKNTNKCPGRTDSAFECCVTRSGEPLKLFPHVTVGLRVTRCVSSATQFSDALQRWVGWTIAQNRVLQQVAVGIHVLSSDDRSALGIIRESSRVTGSAVRMGASSTATTAELLLISFRALRSPLVKRSGIPRLSFHGDKLGDGGAKRLKPPSSRSH